MDARVGLRHLVPSASTWVEVPHTRAARERAADQMRQLPPGAPVVLADRRFGSRRRSRELARLAAVEVDRELLAIPSIDAPDFVVGPLRQAEWYDVPVRVEYTLREGLICDIHVTRRGKRTFGRP